MAVCCTGSAAMPSCGWSTLKGGGTSNRNQTKARIGVPYYGALASGAMAVRMALLIVAWQCKRNFNKVAIDCALQLFFIRLCWHLCSRVCWWCLFVFKLSCRGSWLTCSARKVYKASFGAGSEHMPSKASPKDGVGCMGTNAVFQWMADVLCSVFFLFLVLQTRLCCALRTDQ